MIVADSEPKINLSPKEKTEMGENLKEKLEDAIYGYETESKDKGEVRRRWWGR